MRVWPFPACSGSTGLKSLVRKLQCPTILCNCPHDILGHAVGHARFDFQRHLNVGSHQAREMGNHFFGDLAGISTDPGCIE
jgi:hypothetical protein